MCPEALCVCPIRRGLRVAGWWLSVGFLPCGFSRRVEGSETDWRPREARRAADEDGLEMPSLRHARPPGARRLHAALPSSRLSPSVSSFSESISSYFEGVFILLIIRKVGLSFETPGFFSSDSHFFCLRKKCESQERNLHAS